MMSSKARSIAREIARRHSVADFDECALDVVVVVEPLREGRRLCPACREKRRAEASTRTKQDDLAGTSGRGRLQ